MHNRGYAPTTKPEIAPLYQHLQSSSINVAGLQLPSRKPLTLHIPWCNSRPHNLRQYNRSKHKVRNQRRKTQGRYYHGDQIGAPFSKNSHGCSGEEIGDEASEAGNGEWPWTAVAPLWPWGPACSFTLPPPPSSLAPSHRDGPPTLLLHLTTGLG